MSKKPYTPAEVEVLHLANCKHCGGKAQIKAFTGKFYHGWVGCPACGIYKQWTASPKEAVEIWNRSAAAHE